MPANFPTNPTVNQTYTYAGVSWFWTGSRWRVLPNTPTSANLQSIAGSVILTMKIFRNPLIIMEHTC